jgi:uncharacterized protein YkwD
MNRIIIFSLLVLNTVLLNSQQSITTGNNDFNYYRELNSDELKLSDYKDDDQSLKLKLMQVEVINESRKKQNAAPVKLDILASRVANKMCIEAANNDYTSHWNLNGEKPYHRYAFAGGNDHVSENAYGEWVSDTYDTSATNISELMKSAHGTFMAERAPADGHKKNIIDKIHNFVGIGYCITENQFRYYEEFIDRYYTFENIPQTLKIDEPGSVTVKTDGPNFLYYLIIYREKVPIPLKVAQLKKTGGYEDYTNEQYLVIPAWELAKFRSGNTYNIPLKFSKEGLFYIHIYQDKKEIIKPVSLNTNGKVQASGIVIKVTR